MKNKYKIGQVVVVKNTKERYSITDFEYINGDFLYYFNGYKSNIETNLCDAEEFDKLEKLTDILLNHSGDIFDNIFKNIILK